MGGKGLGLKVKDSRAPGSRVKSLQFWVYGLAYTRGLICRSFGKVYRAQSLYMCRVLYIYICVFIHMQMHVHIGDIEM